MTDLLYDPQSAQLFLEGQDAHYKVAHWAEDDEEKVPERAKKRVKKKKKGKKKKVEAPKKVEGKDVDEKSNSNNEAKINLLSATAKPFVPSTFAEAYPFPTGPGFGSSNGSTNDKANNIVSIEKRGRKDKSQQKKKNSSNANSTETTSKDTKKQGRPKKDSGKRLPRKEKSNVSKNQAMSLQPSQVKKNGAYSQLESERNSDTGAPKDGLKIQADPLSIMDRAVSKIKGLPYYKLSNELSNIVGEGPMTRADAISKLWNYIKQNELHVKVAGALDVKCDEKLKKIFGQGDGGDAAMTVKGMHIGKLLKAHFIKKVGYTNPKKKIQDKMDGKLDAHQNDGKKNDASLEQKNKKKRSNRKKWWKSMTEVDPISLEPIGSLKYPPFEIVGKEGHKHFFDGQCLASYMVGTSSFFNPLSREPLSSHICQRLDIYLQNNKLKKMRVLEAFNLNKKMVENETTENSGHSRQLQRDAASLMSSIFEPRRYQEQQVPHRRQRNGRNSYAREVEEVRYDASTGVRMFDDDSWVEASPINLQQDFPSLGSGGGMSTVPSSEPEIGYGNTTSDVGGHRQENTAPTWDVVAGAGRVPFMQSQAEFPAFQNDDGTKSSSRSGGENTKAHGNWSRGLSVEAMRTKLRNSDQEDNFSTVKRPERLRLKLKARSKGLANDTDSDKEDQAPLHGVGASKSIFGEARPREISLKQQGRVDNEQVGYDGDLTALQEGNFLCPYSPWMLAMGRTMGQRWLLNIESTLRQFVREGPGMKVLQPSLASMPIKQRALIHEYCQNHWNFATSSVDPEPKRHVRVFKSGEPHIPFLLLSESVLSYGAELGKGVNLSERPGGANTSFKSDAGRVAILGIQGPGNQRVTSEQVHSLFRNKCRRSEYTLNWIHDDRNLIVEFATRTNSRKSFQHLLDKHGRDGPISWLRVQWWPAPISYAQQQLGLIASKERTKKIVEKEKKKKALERRKKEEVARREHDQIRTRKSRVRDGWFDSDEEQPSASSSDENEVDSHVYTGVGYNALAGDASDEDDFELLGKSSEGNSEVERQRDLLEKEEATKRRRKLLNRTNKPMGIVRTTIMDHADDNAWEALMSNSEDSNSSDEDVVLKSRNARHKLDRRSGNGKSVPSFTFTSGTIPVSTDPTVLYAEQLSSLRDMGMLDLEKNLAVLASVDGDMNLAVERLIS